MLSFETTRNPHGHGGLFDAIHRIESSILAEADTVFICEQLSTEEVGMRYPIGDNVKTCLPLDASPYGQKRLKKNTK
jgi:1,4-alpha-glucan branching enzyme